MKKIILVLSIGITFSTSIFAFPTGEYICPNLIDPTRKTNFFLQSNGTLKMRMFGIVMRGKWIDDGDRAILLLNKSTGKNMNLFQEGDNFQWGENNVPLLSCQKNNSTIDKQKWKNQTVQEMQKVIQKMEPNYFPKTEHKSSTNEMKTKKMEEYLRKETQKYRTTAIPKVNNNIPQRKGPKFSRRVCDELSDETHFFLPKYIKKATTYKEYIVAVNKIKSSYQKQYDHCGLPYSYLTSEVIKSAEEWQKEYDIQMINKTGARRDAFTGWGPDGTLPGPDFTYVD